MKKYIKTAIISCIAVCLIACAGIFATACQNTSQYEITVISATDETPVEGVRINFCLVGGTCAPKASDKNGKIVYDLSQDMYKGGHNFHIAVLNSSSYELLTAGFKHDDEGILVDTEKDGYSITIKVKAL